MEVEVAQRATVHDLVDRIVADEDVLEYAKNVASAIVAGPHNHCAATLSTLLVFVGIYPVAVGNMAADLEPYVPTLAADLEKIQNWSRIDLGTPFEKGDVGVVLVDATTHHIYLVLDPTDQAAPLIADNQDGGPHHREVAGNPAKSYSPTKYFLRAPA